ncbi:MAG: MFS transporter [Methanobrevibacter sp.]|jgi:EmrB/QacA subfamily drug resistance transporter|nr:MFS transporter [Candidatus Methanoflexus mossambicus]
MFSNKNVSSEGHSFKWYVVFVSAFISFLVTFISSVMAVVAPPIGADFHMDAIMQNWAVISNLLAIAIFSIPVAKVADKVGLKKLFIIGLIILIVSSFGAAFAFSAESIILFRVIQGIASAILNVCSLAFINEAFPVEDRGKAIGIIMAAIYVGMALSPVLGGTLTFNFGWGSVFLFSIPFIILTLVLTLWKIDKEWVYETKHKFDYIGTILFSLGIFFLIFGFTSLTDLIGQITFVMSILLLIGFYFWEKREQDPIFNVHLIKNLKFSSASLASLISYLASFFLIYSLSYHLQYINGYNTETAGIILIVMPVVMAIVAPIAGKISDKINPQIIATTGMIFITLSMFMLSFLDAKSTILFMVAIMAVKGFGFGLFTAPNTNTIMSSVPIEYSSHASATVSTMRVVGQNLSMGILTLVFAFVMGSVEIVPKVYPLLIKSSEIAAIIATILCILAVICCAIGIKAHSDNSD